MYSKTVMIWGSKLLDYPKVLMYKDTLHYFFSICPKWKLMVIGVPIFKHIIIMCPNFGTPKNNKFSIWNSFSLFLGVPILKHITVMTANFILW